MSSSGVSAEGAAASRLRAMAAMPSRIDPRQGLCESLASISNRFPRKAPALDDWALGHSNNVARRWPEGGLARVPYWIYTDADVYRAEQERIFCGRSWCYVALEAEIPNPGDFVRTYVGEKPVVIVRDSEGSISALLNRCAHRGVEFCQRPRGNVREFMCPYHQWTYDLKGALIGVPFRRGVKRQGGMPADFDPGEHGLRKLAVTRRNGVIFASFASGLQPLKDYFGPSMLALYDRVFDGRQLTV